MSEHAIPSTAVAPPILSIERLGVTFTGGSKPVRAVDGVDLSVAPGETLALVGESGCGKSVTAMSALHLIPRPPGRILFQGRDLRREPPARLREMRRDMQIIFQDPFGSLDPRMTVGRIVAEPLECLGIDGDHALRVRQVLADVALDASFAARYPHELSGGQRQRVAIARALAPAPQILIADEPVSALDVLIRDEIVSLLDDLIARRNLSLVFVSHDLAVVARLCTEIAVMRDGRVVESGPIERVLQNPEHSFTGRLIDAVPRLPSVG